MTDWDDWIGREVRQSDVLNQALASRWLAALDRDPSADGIMPEGIHFCLCTPETSTVQLGEDGHPGRDNSADSFFPPIPLPRRMWAASTIDFLAPLSIGAKVDRISRIASVSEKDGRTGKLGFVEVEHTTVSDGAQAIREKQTLVYREAIAPDAPLTPPQAEPTAFDESTWDHVHVVTPSETLLFRYSALTFNTHRIHYDLPYARDVERYRGLVVHGPLIATLLLGIVAERHGPNQTGSFAFRAISPAIAGEPLHLAIRQNDNALELGAFASDGRQTLTATAQLR